MYTPSEAKLARLRALSTKDDIIAAMAIDLGRAKPLFDSDRERFRQLLTAQARGRGLPLTLMVNGDLKVIEFLDALLDGE